MSSLILFENVQKINKWMKKIKMSSAAVLISTLRVNNASLIVCWKKKKKKKNYLNRTDNITHEIVNIFIKSHQSEHLYLFACITIVPSLHQRWNCAVNSQTCVKRAPKDKPKIGCLTQWLSGLFCSNALDQSISNDRVSREISVFNANDVNTDQTVWFGSALFAKLPFEWSPDWK